MEDGLNKVIVAVDPGALSGLAVFFGDKLVKAGLLKSKLLQRGDEIVVMSIDYQYMTIIEKPVIYPKTKCNPNDLVTLSVRVGRFVEQALKYGEVALVTPREWKGQRPKKVDNEYTLSLLSPAEMEVFERDTNKVAKSYLNNVIDAIGIGLWALGRR